jgi:hypothetical protein
MVGQSASLALHQNPQHGTGSLRILKSMASVAEIRRDRGAELEIAGNGVGFGQTSGKVPTLGEAKTRFRESWEKSCPAQKAGSRASWSSIVPFFNRERDHFHELFRKQGRRLKADDLVAVVAQRRVRDRSFPAHFA